MSSRPRPRPLLARAAAGRSARAKARQALGPLASLRVRANTRKRYAEAYARFSWHCAVFNLALATYFDLDSAARHYLEHLWHDGQPRLWVTDTLAALHYYAPTCKRQLPVAWSLHKAWGKSELPARACPITPAILHGICGLLVSWGYWRDALLALAAFDLVLRTGEMLELRQSDVESSTGRSGMVIRLRGTKVGQRRGADESVVVEDSLVRAAFRLLTQGLEPGDRLLAAQEHHWRYLWNAAIRALKLQHLDVRAYSLRRGGATWLFRKTGSFDRCLDRGRWGNSRNARTYIEDAAAMAASLRLTEAEQQTLEAFAQRFFNWLRSFVDAESISKSEHFSSAASATKLPAPLPADVPTSPKAVRKRPAACIASAQPSVSDTSLLRTELALGRAFAKR